MNYRILLGIIGIVFLCGAVGRPLIDARVIRRCGPPMNIHFIDDETGQRKEYFAIPVWYEYPSLFHAKNFPETGPNKSMRGFHFELQDGTIIEE